MKKIKYKNIMQTVLLSAAMIQALPVHAGNGYSKNGYIQLEEHDSDRIQKNISLQFDQKINSLNQKNKLRDSDHANLKRDQLRDLEEKEKLLESMLNRKPSAKVSLTRRVYGNNMHTLDDIKTKDDQATSRVSLGQILKNIHSSLGLLNKFLELIFKC